VTKLVEGTEVFLVKPDPRSAFGGSPKITAQATDELLTMIVYLDELLPALIAALCFRHLRTHFRIVLFDIALRLLGNGSLTRRYSGFGATRKMAIKVAPKITLTGDCPASAPLRQKLRIE
jgi:hypothetical protein